MDKKELVVGTANIAGAMRGGKDANRDKFKILANQLAKYNPDIIGFQEIIRIPAAGRDDLKSIQTELGGDWFSFFFPQLDSHIHSHPRKWETDIFIEYHSLGQRIYQGTGILVKKKKNGENKSRISINNFHNNKQSNNNESDGEIIPWRVLA
jgi:exonuclease III